MYDITCKKNKRLGILIKGSHKTLQLNAKVEKGGMIHTMEGTLNPQYETSQQRI